MSGLPNLPEHSRFLDLLSPGRERDWTWEVVACCGKAFWVLMRPDSGLLPLLSHLALAPTPGGGTPSPSEHLPRLAMQ